MQAFSLGVAEAVLALGLLWGLFGLEIVPFTGVIGGAISTGFGQSMAHGDL